MNCESIVLKFEAPLMSFGGPIVDNFGVIQEFPARSLLTGLVGNALGYDHRDFNLLQRLQERICFAVRIDRPGREIIDYQTVDLGQEFLDMKKLGWTTRGQPDTREGGTASSGTHIRYRHFIADGSVTVVITLNPTDEAPTLDSIAAALVEPARPLFLGRKCCIPSEPVFIGKAIGTSLLDVLKAHQAKGTETRFRAQWPAEDGCDTESRIIPVTDERDWSNQFHCGKRFVRQGIIRASEGSQ